QAAGTLTLGAAAAIRGNTGTIGGSSYFGSTMTLINQGLISAEVAGHTITVPQAFTNNGTSQATGGGTLNVNNLTGSGSGSFALSGSGGSLILNGTNYVFNGLTVAGGTATLNGTWSNTGTLSVTGGTLNLAGAFTTAGIGTVTRTPSMAGTVNLTRTLNNAGATLTLNATTGSWVLNGGTTSRGTARLDDGPTL